MMSSAMSSSASVVDLNDPAVASFHICGRSEFARRRA
jgi:hypothetical protein